MALKKDKQGLYFNEEFKADNYSDAIRELYQLNEIPKGFCVNEAHEANGYSVVDSVGVQHIYELSPKEFYNAFMKLD
jgi:predicted transcriptional regulator